MRPALVLSALLTALVIGCGTVPKNPGSATRTLTVFAAASLTEAFTEIETAFEAANPGVNVRCNFAGSPMLRTQIEAGAPADVFASANQNEMEALVAANLVEADQPQVFLTNELVVILPPTNPARVVALQDLARPGLKLILAADEVPVGNYARQSLASMGRRFGPQFDTQVLANVVSNEDNVKQVVAKVLLGEGDAGIVYRSDAIAASELGTIEIPPELNVIAEYPIAALSDSQLPQLAAEFTAYVLSPEARAILQKWGFGPAD
jgi:molybdate transport system substrate-binding protein